MSLGALFLYTHTVLNVSYMSEHIHSALAVGNIPFDTNVKPSQFFQLVCLSMEDHKRVCMVSVGWASTATKLSSSMLFLEVRLNAT